MPELPDASHPWLSDAEYRHELTRRKEACRRLLAIADSFIGRPVAVEPMVVLEEWARATKTFRAVVALAADGYGPQAQILARPIFESAMLIAWAVRNPAVADDHVDLHARLGIELHLAARRSSEFWDDGSHQHLTRDERERAVELFGRRGSRLWSGHRTLEELVKENIAEIADPFVKRQYDATFNVVVGWANRMTHSTGLSTRAQRSENPFDPDHTDAVAVLITGPSRSQSFDALHSGSTHYLMVMYALPDSIRSGLDARLRDAAGLSWRAWKHPSELVGLGDADPCPCDEPNTRWGTCHKWTEGLVDLRVERRFVDGPRPPARQKPKPAKRAKRHRR
ncbi:MAG: DUF5677 domain-containing protein [Solirubrobacteraceae bacterium]